MRLSDIYTNTRMNVGYSIEIHFFHFFFRRDSDNAKKKEIFFAEKYTNGPNISPRVLSTGFVLPVQFVCKTEESSL